MGTTMLSSSYFVQIPHQLLYSFLNIPLILFRNHFFHVKNKNTLFKGQVIIVFR